MQSRLSQLNHKFDIVFLIFFLPWALQKCTYDLLTEACIFVNLSMEFVIFDAFSCLGLLHSLFSTKLNFLGLVIILCATDMFMQRC